MPLTFSSSSPAIGAFPAQYTVVKIPFDTAVYEDGTELPVAEQGTRADAFGGKITQFTLRSGYWGATIGIQNNTRSAVNVTVDCAASKNVVRCYNVIVLHVPAMLL